MTDHVVDTNVLLVASAAHPYSPFGDSDLPKDLQGRVFEWLTAFQKDTTRNMVWDVEFKIYDEYRNKLTAQDYGMLVVNEKMAQARWIDIEYDENGDGVVPKAFSAFDRSDRKLLAVLLADTDGTSLVNATDTDWLEIEAQLQDAAAQVDHLLEHWLRAKYDEKTGP
ncbi:MAG: hypothetical protein KAI47_04010 [Deltaproteobacteria bacterium]|nr:hypothetical protein [Deltaproteobacteria bacterium]